ncbi:MAG: lamin tail domain-containing protein [Myxococcota bacterium]
MHRAAVAILLAGCPLPDEPDEKADDTGAEADSAADTAGPVLLAVNEFLADNTSFNADETGEFGEWIELWNGGDADLVLDGYSLSDDVETPGDPLRGGLVVPAGGWLVLWADARPEVGPDHLAFDLDAGGGQIGLFYPGGDHLDAIEYGACPPDLAAARVPDGSLDWRAAVTPTPGESNGG